MISISEKRTYITFSGLAVNKVQYYYHMILLKIFVARIAPSREPCNYAFLSKIEGV